MPGLSIRRCWNNILIDWLENTFPLINMVPWVYHINIFEDAWANSPGHVLLTVPWYYNGNYEWCNQFQRTTTGKETKTHTHTSTQHIIELLISTNTRWCLQPFLKPISKKNSSKWEFSALNGAKKWATFIFTTAFAAQQCGHRWYRLRHAIFAVDRQPEGLRVSGGFKGPKFGEWIQIVVGRNLLLNCKTNWLRGWKRGWGLSSKCVEILLGDLISWDAYHNPGHVFRIRSLNGSPPQKKTKTDFLPSVESLLLRRGVAIPQSIFGSYWLVNWVPEKHASQSRNGPPTRPYRQLGCDISQGK